MLGRGDLKAEIPIEDTPYVEEKIIKRMKTMCIRDRIDYLLIHTRKIYL